jgi:hypothetical protein
MTPRLIGRNAWPIPVTSLLRIRLRRRPRRRVRWGDRVRLPFGAESISRPTRFDVRFAEGFARPGVLPGLFQDALHGHAPSSEHGGRRPRRSVQGDRRRRTRMRPRPGRFSGPTSVLVIGGCFSAGKEQFMRILIANTPLMYRESLALAVHRHKPGLRGDDRRPRLYGRGSRALRAARANPRRRWDRGSIAPIRCWVEALLMR